MKEKMVLFKALGEETRYRTIMLLLSGEKCACELPKLIGRAQSNTSMHLAELLEWELVRSRRKGRRILYSRKDKKIEKIFKAIDAR